MKTLRPIDIDLDVRLIGLDLVRVFAILAVMVSHGRHFFPTPDLRPYFAIGGFFGVELFFVLSGYLIGGLLLRAAGDPRRGDLHLVSEFWVRRWFRTIPTYLLFVVLNILLFQTLYGAKEWNWLYFVFSQNFAWPHPTMMPEAWSLAVEEWFYLLFPLLAVVAGAGRISGKNRVLAAAIGFILMIGALRFAWWLVFDADWGKEVRGVVLLRLDAIAFGILAVWVVDHYPAHARRFRVLFCALGVGLTGWLALLYGRDLVNADHGDVPGFYHTLYFWLVSFALAAMLPWFASLKFRLGGFAYAVAFLSVISYAMYLSHFSFVIPFVADLQLYRIHWIVPIVLYFTGTIVLSAVVYWGFEKRMTGLREHFYPKSS